jgi:hypothetical protein
VEQIEVDVSQVVHRHAAQFDRTLAHDESSLQTKKRRVEPFIV